MIRQKPTEGFDNLIHTYSDKGFKIRQIETGVIYDEADDVIPCRYTYEETDELINSDLSDAEVLAELMEVLNE